MTVERRALSGSLVTALSVLVQFGQAIIMVPLFLEQWGSEKYGLWLVLQGAFALIITLDAGHQTFVGNELAKLYPVDRVEMRRVLASAFWVALLIGVVELMIGAALWLGGLLPALMGTSEENARSHNLGLALVALLLMWMLVGSVGGVLVRLLPPAGRFARSAAWGVASQVMLLCIWAIGVASNVSILTLVLVQVTAQVIYTVALFRDLRIVCAEVYPFWSPADLRLGLRNLAKSVVLTGTRILTQLQQNGLNLLISSLFGAALLPVLTTARTLANVFVQATNVVASPLSPDIVRYHVKGETDKLVGAWAGIWFVGGAIINVGLVVSLLVVKPFYTFWTRAELSLEWGLYLPLVAAVSIKAYAVPLFTYLSGLNHLRGLMTMASAQTAVILGGTWALASVFGLAGATLAILGGEIVGTAILIVFVRSLLMETGAVTPAGPFLIAAVPPLICCVAFAAAGLSSTSHFVIVAIALGALGVAIGAQWRALPASVKTRMLHLLRRKSAGSD